LRIGLVNHVVPPGDEVTTALAWAEQIAAFPQETMLADREAAIRGIGLPFEEGLALERRLGWGTVRVGRAGAARFRDGAGRGGAGVPGFDPPRETD
jgi:enoyl-CoA hydratase